MSTKSLALGAAGAFVGAAAAFVAAAGVCACEYAAPIPKSKSRAARIILFHGFFISLSPFCFNKTDLQFDFSRVLLLTSPVASLLGGPLIPTCLAWSFRTSEFPACGIRRWARFPSPYPLDRTGRR